MNTMVAKIRNYFRRSTTMETQEHNLASQGIALRLDLDAIESALQDPTDPRDPAELAAERDRLKAAIEAVKIRRQQQANAEYRAGLATREAEFRARVEPVMAEIGRLVPALQLALAEARDLMREAANTPLTGVKQVDELFGIGLDFPTRVLAAIRDGAPRTEWDYSVGGGKPPKLAPEGGVHFQFVAPHPRVPTGKSGIVYADGSVETW